MNDKLHDVRKIEDLKDMLNQSVELFGDKPLFIFKTETPNKFDNITFKEYKKQVEALGTALVNLGLKDKKNSSNR